MGKVTLQVDYSFFLVLSLFLLADQSGWAWMLLVSVFFHECSHLAAMAGLGVQVRQLRLTPFGVEIRQQSPNHLGYGRESMIYLAGPVCNLALAGLAFLAAGRLQGRWLELSAINLVMGLFQLIPLVPLDGGQLLGCLTAGMAGPEAARSWCGILGILLLAPVLAYGIWLFLREGNFTLLVFCLVLLMKNGGRER